MNEAETHIYIAGSALDRGPSRTTNWMPAWLLPSVATVEEPVEAGELRDNCPEVEPPPVESPIPENFPELEPVAQPPITRRRISSNWQSWTEHRDGVPWRITQAAGELIVPWRDDDEHHEPKPGICRCGSAETRDTSIHDGRTLRRDCANCGRFVAFPLWYGIQQ